MDNNTMFCVVHEVPTNDRDINGDPIKRYFWSATFRASSFGEAEEKALANLKDNKDTNSTISKIELW